MMLLVRLGATCVWVALQLVDGADDLLAACCSAPPEAATMIRGIGQSLMARTGGLVAVSVAAVAAGTLFAFSAVVCDLPNLDRRLARPAVRLLLDGDIGGAGFSLATPS